MRINREDKIHWINLIPYFGIVLFIGLYVYSSTLYPGGSQADLNAEGFSWVNNYWCNLMNANGQNGQVNPARSTAIFAWIVLCMSMMVFFIQFAIILVNIRWWRQVIIIGAVFSMIFASLIFSKYHDLMTTLSSLFGLFVVIGIIREIYRSDLVMYKFLGLLCLILLGLNNFIYYSEAFLQWLPILQKISMAIVLLWILGLNLVLIKTKRALAQRV